MEAGLRSGDGVSVHRRQIILARAREVHALAIARMRGPGLPGMVRNALPAFTAMGTTALMWGSSVPHTIHAAFDAATADRRHDLLHHIRV